MLWLGSKNVFVQQLYHLFKKSMHAGVHCIFPALKLTTVSILVAPYTGQSVCIWTPQATISNKVTTAK